jgi:hypothetical protein
MRNLGRLLVAALAAVCLLSVAVGAASANHLEVSNAERGFRLVGTQSFTYSAFILITCSVTLEGTFSARTFEKVVGRKIGDVTRATFEACNNGDSVRPLAETLPWEVQYVSFSGVLPAITAVTTKIVRGGYLLSGSFGGCLASASAENPETLALELSSGAVVSGQLSATLPLRTVSGICPATTSVRGSYTATVQGETAHTIVRLI